MISILQQSAMATVDSSGNATIQFNVPAGQTWLVQSVSVSTNQATNTTPIPQATIYNGWSGTNRVDGTFTGNSDTSTVAFVAQPGRVITVQWVGGINGTVATASISGQVYSGGDSPLSGVASVGSAGFQNSVVGGITLVRPAIQSPDYKAGVSGWSIAADGSAEFADLTIDSAEITVKDSGGNVVARLNTEGLTVYAEPPETGFINVNPNALGILQQIFSTGVSMEGASANIQALPIGSGTSQFLGFGIFGPEAVNEHSQVGINLNSAEEDGTVTASGALPYFENNGTEHDYIAWSAAGAAITGRVYGVEPGTSPADPDQWHSMGSGQNGWAGDGLSIPVAYRMAGDGSVEFTGWLQGGTTTDGTVFFTLPAGYRPSGFVQFKCPVPFTTSQTATVQVAADGTMAVFNLAGHAHLSLDNCRFPVS